MRIGIHTSIAGGLDKAAERAHEMGANAFQIFSASPRMWRASPPDTAAIERLAEARARWDLHPLAVHANYLINLAAAGPAVRRKSIAGFRGELERAEAIGAGFLIVHPGSYQGQAVEQAAHAFAGAVARAARDLPVCRVALLLENTAGSGCALGSRFEELAQLAALARPLVPFAVGFCLDTCHLLAAGYDVASARGLEETLAAAGRTLGLENVPVLHANDSQHPLGSRRDRHQHIGRGYIGESGFRRILNHPLLKGKAFILETPVEEAGDGPRNVETLKRLCRRSPTITTRLKPGGTPRGKPTPRSTRR